MNEHDALLILNAVPGVGNATIRKLLAFYGTAVKVLSRSQSELTGESGLSSKVAENIVQFPKEVFLKNEQALMDKRGVKVVTFLDEAYPELLREIADAPVVLYVKGDLSLHHSLSMAIVGSRRSSLYGISISEKFAVRLAELGFVIVSGMARGIDTAAHRGALKAGGTTIAALGCGLSRVYPPENKELLEDIAKNGAVISEFPMEAAPISNNFPRRNRIISGLSLGTVVVEAAQRSGALITADFAMEQGREVFAVPGKIDQPSSSGVHNLIKQGAKLITSVDDVLEDIEPHISAYLKSETKPAETHHHREKPPANLSDGEQQVYGHITDRPVHVDELMARCGPAVPVMSILLQLECRHLVKQLPGKMFKR